MTVGMSFRRTRVAWYEKQKRTPPPWVESEMERWDRVIEVIQSHPTPFTALRAKGLEKQARALEYARYAAHPLRALVRAGVPPYKAVQILKALKVLE